MRIKKNIILIEKMKDEEAQSNHLKNSKYIGRIRARHLNPVMQDSFLHGAVAISKSTTKYSKFIIK